MHFMPQYIHRAPLGVHIAMRQRHNPFERNVVFMDKRLLGAMGEAVAAKHYRAAGYVLLAANYRTRQGEIDLIAQKDNTIVFIEVKTRTEKSIAAPREFVTKTKQMRLALAAGSFIAANPSNDAQYRFDVAEVYAFADGKSELSIIENAFTL